MAAKRLVKLLATAATAAALAVQPKSRQTSWTTGQMVQTTSGDVQGHAAANRTEVSEYLGIPFVQPPVGDLRFTRPAPITETKAINGSNFGYSCPGPQIYRVEANATGVTAAANWVLDQWNEVGQTFSEDCLTLNVWTKPQTGEARKAVMLYFYGGGFYTGSSAVPLYNGQVFADEQDVVLVSANHRLSMFGFPGSAAADQNLGLFDMRAAVEWVYQNIAQFGGDPDRITLFGHSTGATGIDMMLYAFPNDTIVKGTILQSANAQGSIQRAPRTLQTALTSWANATASLGCSENDEAAKLECMRTKSMDEIIALQFPADARGIRYLPASGTGVRFLPTIDNETVFSDYRTRSDFKKVPLLIGNTHTESSINLALAVANAGSTTPTPTTSSTDAIYTCPIAERANLAVANDLPVWRYRWLGSFPNTRIIESVDSGAWHGSELGVLFGTNEAVVPNTPEENEIGALMRGLWATFAKDPVDGLASYEGGVPRYAPGTESLIQLGLNNSVELLYAAADTYDGACGLTVSGNDNATTVTVNGGEGGWRLSGLANVMLGLVVLGTNTNYSSFPALS